MQIKKIGKVRDVLSVLEQKFLPYMEDYLAMYSSWYGAIVTDPRAMLIPLDDHMVHRGDGVFEAFKCVDGNIYQLEAHLERLNRSMEKVSLSLPCSRQELVEIICETIRAGGEKTCIGRLYISRGPGDFSPKPYKSIGSQLYVVVTKHREAEERKRVEGCSLIVSRVPIKNSFYATIKSCNYLPNVLMKMEAHERGADYAIGVDEEGRLTEGATENFGIITEEKEFFIPPFDGILKGTTISRALEMAQVMVEEGLLKAAAEKPLSVEDMKQAKEILVFGTTMDVLPITLFEGEKVGDGRVGEFYRLFYEKLTHDMHYNRELLTPVW